MYLFTLRWQQHRDDSIVSNCLATILDYIKEIGVCLRDQNNTAIIKTIGSSFISVILSEAYFLKLLISINRKNKLKLDLPNEEYIYQILPFTYQESLLKKADQGKIIKNDNAYFNSVTMLIEGIQNDKDLFQSFRERNSNILQSSV